MPGPPSAMPDAPPRKTKAAPSSVSPRAIVLVRADDHVGVAVAVHVARARHAPAEARIGLVRLELGRQPSRGPVRDPRRAAQEDEGGALAGLAAVVAVAPTITSA